MIVLCHRAIWAQKDKKINTNLYLWMEKPSEMGHLLQVNTKTIPSASAGHRHPPIQHSLDALGRNLIFFFFLSEKLLNLVSQTFTASLAWKENPPSNPSWVYHSDASWSRFGVGWKCWTRIGFDATFKPFSSQLEFLESGSPQLGDTL